MVFIACVAVLLCLQLSRTGFPAGELTAESWLTTPDRKNLLTPQPVSVFSGTDKPADTVIEVDAGRQYQTIEGFGAAVTGSSAYLIGGKLSASQREGLLDDLFTEDGIRLSYVRHTIGASDFSVDESGKPSSYTYDDVPPGESDFELNNFSVRRDARVIGLLREIVNKNQQLKVLGTPWTAPPWMKYGENVYNGWYLNYTDERVYRAYADYFVKYIQAYEAAGVPINAITVQNEPEFTTPDYPSMSMGAEEQAKFIGGYLGPALERSGLGTKIIAFDHNWDLGESYARTVLGDGEANKYTEGTAYHCYGGEPDVMTQIHDAFPDKAVYFTECSGGSWSEDFGNNLSWLMSKLLIGATRNWAETVLLWNLALDPEGGPVNGGCGDCRGVVTIDPESGAVTRNAEYYALGHASKFVGPGAVRIDSSPAAADVENVAFRNQDGTIVLLAANTGETPHTVKVVWKSRSFAYSLPSHSAVTFRWPG